MTAKDLAFLFPGQGSQSVGMLGELAQRHASVRATFDEASRGAGADLWAISQEGPEDELNRTELTQPALLAAGVAVWRVWTGSGGDRPALIAGHSLGEYTALVCAGAIGLEAAAGLVRARGRLMQAAVPAGVGAMAAVLGTEDALIAEVCAEVAGSEVVAPANFNSPGQTVIAGHATAIDRALARLAERGVRKAVKLPVSVPSHCALMRDAADELATRIAAVEWSMPGIPVVQNADAVAHGTVAAIQDALARQLYQPVRWTECVAGLRAQGATRYAECGPGKVLTGLLKRIDKTLECRAFGTPDEMAAALADWSGTESARGEAMP